MYAPFFGLQHPPFSIAPDPRYLFMSERHREALAHLLYGLDAGGGFVLLTGEVGAGKTTVCRCFLEQIPSHCDVAYIFNPKLTVGELLRSICDEFGVPHQPSVAGVETVKDYIDPLNASLLAAHGAGRNTVLIIDEAQNLSADVLEQLRLDQNEKELIEHSIVQMELERGLDRNAAIADMRYTFIEALVKACVVKPHESREHVRSVKIDRILTGRYTAIPAFLVIMGLVFWLTFGVIGAALQGLMEDGIAAIIASADAGLKAFGTNDVVRSLAVDGVLTGVGSVLTFLPIIVVLFLFLSILEDSGYMARVAFVMDKVLRRFGLSGRSFVPMLVGFGCTVPAIMSTRTLPSEHDRKMTVMLTPFMSCSAKLPVYGLLCGAFFPQATVPAMVSLYLIGIVVGCIAALVLNRTAFKGDPVPFIMELPNYRLPSVKTTVMLAWDKAKDFITKAFTIIFAATVVIWFLQTFDIRFNVVADQSQSLLAGLGSIIAPVLAPLGFGDWRASTALVTGLIAKESVISTLTVLLGATSPVALSAMFSPFTAYVFLVFTLLYPPCVAAIGAVKSELGARYAVAVFAFQVTVAWIVAFVVHSAGILLGLA